MSFYEYASFQILVSDLQKICEFIEPDDRNNSAYSHRVFELLCRVCIDFDLVCCNLYQIQHTSLTTRQIKNLKMSDYETFFSTHHSDLISTEVGLLFWRPSSKYISPLEDWGNGNDLSWFDDYNSSKHNIAIDFDKANLENLTFAIAGLYLLLQKHFGVCYFQPYSTNRSSGGSGSATHSTKKIDGQIFCTRTRV